MARGINKVIIVGNATADADVRSTAGGSVITTIRLATNETWKDKQSGEMQERTEYHRVKFFGRLAEIAGEYIRKGQQVYVEGSLRTDKYTDKDGIERYTTDIIANEMQLLGGRGQGQQHEDRAERPQRAAGTGAGYGSGQGRGGAQQASRRAPAPVPAGDFNGHSDDDIPF